ncbi:peptidoglycan DD-metalloendopeptidase family protein [Tessaracoccus sp. OS52]|uniref:M23 family metallopeptidase n=1 Tax=Tessaracoccus sp. OS52 TaxID=2886691 RepID=UPI001D103D6B|nr:M23 family metallopeptidase [Tessaracoccus sp. OS52]MCC2593676.1 peptidoglycan DD-metalloendopeptidase family protein [Tessaracoccus sp. OS52]
MAGMLPRAQAAELPDFQLALPVPWGATVQAGGTHTHASGVRSSVDLGASNNVSIAVSAAADGVASVKAGCSVTIDHGDGWRTQYYHLKNIPSGLNGAKVVAGQKLGMTGMPGTETCGRGTFRHVHLTLYRDGVEVPISGLSIGGYTVHDYGRSYCGYWTRDSDGAIVADARRACLAVPSVTNNILNPATLVGRTGDDASRGSERPVIAESDTISAVLLYVTEGNHTVGGRAWRTDCEPYSQTERCFTEIWATQTVRAGSGYAKAEGWVFNNLTYKPMSRATWRGNPLGNTGEWIAVDGRRWRTECDTANTGSNGCRSYIWSSVLQLTLDSSGRQRATTSPQWVFNNIVHFSAASAVAAAAGVNLTQTTSLARSAAQPELEPATPPEPVVDQPVPDVEPSRTPDDVAPSEPANPSSDPDSVEPSASPADPGSIEANDPSANQVSVQDADVQPADVATPAPGES